MAQFVLTIIRFRNGSTCFKDLSTNFSAKFFEQLSIFKHVSHSNFRNVLCNFPKATTEVLPKFLANSIQW